VSGSEGVLDCGCDIVSDVVVTIVEVLGLVVTVVVVVVVVVVIFVVDEDDDDDDGESGGDEEGLEAGVDVLGMMKIGTEVVVFTEVGIGMGDELVVGVWIVETKSVVVVVVVGGGPDVDVDPVEMSVGSEVAVEVDGGVGGVEEDELFKFGEECLTRTGSH
jgi:hypothetical protein